MYNVDHGRIHTPWKGFRGHGRDPNTMEGFRDHDRNLKAMVVTHDIDSGGNGSDLGTMVGDPATVGSSLWIMGLPQDNGLTMMRDHILGHRFHNHGW